MPVKGEQPSYNLVPLPYRHVSVQPYDGPMTEMAIVAHLLGKDSYRRTRYVILEQGGRCAVAAVKRVSEKPLFSSITEVMVLALPDTCLLVEDESVDTGNRTALGDKALALDLGPETTLVVRGMDGHVNFIHHPRPLPVTIMDVVPPSPPKLLRLARQVLTYADLPPIQLIDKHIDLRDLASQTPEAEAYLIPCRASGLEFQVPTCFLDERPPRQNWTLIGCERSRQFHRHFYKDEAPCIELCPRKLIQDHQTPALIKCCLLEDRVETDDKVVVVPWGATLAQVEAGLQRVVSLSHEP